MGLTDKAQAEEIRISARVDKNQLSLEDSLQLSITVHGVQNAPDPRLPELPDFKIRAGGTSSSTQIINGEMSTTVTKNYQLVPQKTGTFTIAPATLILAGVAYQTEPITLTVSPSTQNTRKKTSSAFVETSISNENPFVNEQVIYTFKLYRRVEARNFNLAMSYEENDFRKEDLGDAKVVSQVINGMQYKVHELSAALFPIHSGQVQIPPAILELDFINRSRNSRQRNPFPGFFDDSFFGSRGSTIHKILRSDPIQVNVRPLPNNGKPKNFSNLVGKIELSATLGKKKLEVGDTTTLTVKLTGPGHVKELSLVLPKMEDTFKIYPDQPESKTFTQGNDLIGEKVFKFALVPLKSGIVTLPPITLPYFDPATEIYQTAMTPSVALTILPASDSEKMQITESKLTNEHTPGNNIKILGEDILPIHTQLADFEEARGPDMMFYTAGMMISPVLFLLFTGYVRYNLRLKYDTAFVRNRRAYKVASQKLKRLASSPSDGNNPREFAKILSEIFREYIGNKLNLQGKAITSMEVERKLMERHFSEEQAVLTRKLLEKYESLQYAPNNLAGSDDLIDESRKMLDQLEQQV